MGGSDSLNVQVPMDRTVPVVLEGPLSLSREEGQFRLASGDGDADDKLRDQFASLVALLKRCHGGDDVLVGIGDVDGRRVVDVRIARTRAVAPQPVLRDIGRDDDEGERSHGPGPFESFNSLSVSVILDAIVRVGVMKGHLIDTEDAETAAKLISKLVLDEIRVSIVDDVTAAVAAKLSGSAAVPGGSELPAMVTADDIVQLKYLRDRKMAWRWLRWALDLPAGGRGRLVCPRDQFERWYRRYQEAGKNWSDEEQRQWRDELHHAAEETSHENSEAKERA